MLNNVLSVFVGEVVREGDYQSLYQSLYQSHVSQRGKETEEK